MVEPSREISIRRQCQLLEVSRSTLYYKAKEPSGETLELMVEIDKIHMEHPYYGSRKVTQVLRQQWGRVVNRKKVQRLMRQMGMESVAPQSKRASTSVPRKEDRKYPYLLRNRRVKEVNEVWAADITYIPVGDGQAYLVAIIDWHSRLVLSWELSNTLHTDFCVRAMERALARYGKPQIVNTDQGSQFTDRKWTGALLSVGIMVSMDGKGRYTDNIFVERLWRSLKYEEVYLTTYETMSEARAGIGAYLKFFNDERPHKALGYQPPRRFYDTVQQQAV